MVDFDRSMYVAHEKVAEELVKLELAPNASIGRIIVHFYSIDQKMDSFDPYRDEKRLLVA